MIHFGTSLAGETENKELVEKLDADVNALNVQFKSFPTLPSTPENLALLTDWPIFRDAVRDLTQYYIGNQYWGMVTDEQKLQLMSWQALIPTYRARFSAAIATAASAQTPTTPTTALVPATPGTVAPAATTATFTPPTFPPLVPGAPAAVQPAPPPATDPMRMWLIGGAAVAGGLALALILFRRPAPTASTAMVPASTAGFGSHRKGGKRAETPTLDRLIARGVVRYDPRAREYVGIASDGVKVSVGSDAVSTERYLRARPDPSQW